MSPRVDAGTRLRRLLVVLPWINEHQDATLDEIARRFDIAPNQLEDELALASMCGLPPYTFDRLIDLEIEDGHVRIRFAEYLARPLRLSASEALAVLTAGEALLALPGSDRVGPLASALTKLRTALGLGEGVQVDVPAPPTVGTLRDAVARHERVEIDYYTFGRNDWTTRRVDPHRVFSAAGSWYVDAYCHRARDVRRFRADRIEAVRPTEETFAPVDLGPAVPLDVFEPGPDDRRVTMVLPAGAGWVVEAYPTERVETIADGRVRVVLVAGELPWLERLLLRVGPGAVVEEPEDLRSLGAQAAQRLLARYQRHIPTSM